MPNLRAPGVAIWGLLQHDGLGGPRECSKPFLYIVTDVPHLVFTSRSSMTSVPKPLKFLRPHLQTLKDTYAKLKKPEENKKLLADIISLLAMTDAPVENVMPESLKYRLLGSGEDIGSWGHEVRLDTFPSGLFSMRQIWARRSKQLLD